MPHAYVVRSGDFATEITVHLCTLCQRKCGEWGNQQYATECLSHGWPHLTSAEAEHVESAKNYLQWNWYEFLAHFRHYFSFILLILILVSSNREDTY